MKNLNRRHILSQVLTGFSAAGFGMTFPVNAVAAISNSVQPHDGTHARDLARLLKRSELVIGFPLSDDYPFFYRKNDETVGMEVDLAQRFAKSLGLDLKIDRSVKTYNEVVELVEEKKIDLAFHLVPTFKRVQRVSFTNAYILFPHSLIVNRVELAKLGNGATAEQTLQNYQGTIGILAGSAQEEFAIQNFPKSKVVRFTTWDQAVAAVTEGKVVCAYRNEFYIRKILKTNPSLALILRAISFNDLTDHMSIAVSHDNKILKELLNQFVSQRSGQLNIDSVLRQLG
jgi:ABC-type amino acid transport substrate-binding protein